MKHTEKNEEEKSRKEVHFFWNWLMYITLKSYRNSFHYYLNTLHKSSIYYRYATVNFIQEKSWFHSNLAN